jgi:nucleoid DNA-binding protein
MAEALMRAIASVTAGDVVLSADVATSVWQRMLAQVQKSLAQGVPVSLRGVGSLVPVARSGRRYKHPVTGEVHKAKSKVHVRFVASPRLRDILPSGS